MTHPPRATTVGRVQIIRDRRLYDVCIVGSGAGGGMAAKVLAEAGAEVRAARGRRALGRREGRAMFAWNYDSPRRGAGSRRGRSASSTAASAAGTSRASPTRSRPAAVPLVPRAHARRPHQPLGPHLAALRAVGLQGAAAATAWATTGRSATTTSSPTTTSSTSWSGIFGSDRGHGERARRHLPAAAAAALLRAADQEGLRRARASRASRRGCRSSPSRTTAARPATTAASAAAAARPTRTSRRRRCCCRPRSRPAS